VHPLNLSRMRELYSADFQSKRICILEGITITARPTLSLRTLVPHDCMHGLRLKLPVPMTATSLPRYVSPVEVLGSILLGKALSGMQLPSELAIQRENFAAHLRFGEGCCYSYEEARYCAVIFRDSPAIHANHMCGHVSLAAMFGEVNNHGRTLWMDFWQYHQIDNGEAWFCHYAQVVLRAQLSVFIQYGLAIEAHQQNVTLEFSARGDLERIIYQELGGGTFWDPLRAEALPSVNCQHEVYSRDDVFVPFRKCVLTLKHTMLHMHLLPLAKEVSVFFNISEVQLASQVDSYLQTVAVSMEQAAQDTWPTWKFAEYKSRTVGYLHHRDVMNKALLRMRLLQTKEEQYVNEPSEQW